MFREDEIECETIKTDSGEYVVTWIHDPHAEQPYMESNGFSFNGRNLRVVDVEQGEHAGEVLEILRHYQVHSSAAIARYLQIKYGLKGIREVSQDYYTSAPSLSVNAGDVYGIAWAPDDVPDDQADAYTDAAMAEYRAWAEGDTFGWVLTDPSGKQIEVVWGYYGFDREREYTLSEARQTAEYDAAQRIQQTSLAGAGFVGLI